MNNCTVVTSTLGGYDRVTVTNKAGKTLARLTVLPNGELHPITSIYGPDNVKVRPIKYRRKK